LYLKAPVNNAPATGLCEVVPVGGTQAPVPALSLVKYPKIAFSVGTAVFALPPNVSSVLNSLIAAPNSAPIDPSFNSLNPERLKASAFSVAVPVACSILNRSPTLKSPCWSVDTQ
jgi:hypothetical protein